MSSNRILNRRRFTFWVSMGLFTLGDRLGITFLDRLAAAAMRSMDDSKTKDAKEEKAEHWIRNENEAWMWFERETMVDGEWKRTGITLPVNKKTGDKYTTRKGYLDESLVPKKVRFGKVRKPLGSHRSDDEGKANDERRNRHGRPPSKWLRSLNAAELRLWLKTIEVPEAGVSGMTFWVHLTRDHSFNPVRIKGLNEDEQAKLHAAAHYGY